MFNNTDKKEIVRHSFDRVKQDISLLGQEISDLKIQIFQIKDILTNLESVLQKIKQESSEIKKNNTSKFQNSQPVTHPHQEIKQQSQFSSPIQLQNNPSNLNTIDSTHTSTHNSETSTHPVNQTQNTTDKYRVEALKYPYINTSIRNEGVSTDRQTDNQTDRQTPNYFENHSKPVNESLTEASDILESLDGLKREIRLKFKQMTHQEMLVFSTIYQLEEQGDTEIDYKKIAFKLSLSQSSIRDYVQRVINKGIPVLKTKVNNKKILLRIAPKLRKIASLDTISNLRDL